MARKQPDAACTDKDMMSCSIDGYDLRRIANELEKLVIIEKYRADIDRRRLEKDGFNVEPLHIQ